MTQGFFDLSEVESNFPNWQKANRNWAARAAKGTGVRGTSKGTRTSYFYNNGLRRRALVGRTVRSQGPLSARPAAMRHPASRSRPIGRHPGADPDPVPDPDARPDR